MVSNFGVDFKFGDRFLRGRDHWFAIKGSFTSFFGKPYYFFSERFIIRLSRGKSPNLGWVFLCLLLLFRLFLLLGRFFFNFKQFSIFRCISWRLYRVKSLLNRRTIKSSLLRINFGNTSHKLFLSFSPRLLYFSICSNPWIC